MKAVVFHGIGDVRLDDVPEPRITHPTDPIVRLTARAICRREQAWLKVALEPAA